jgi:hypothetical protein
MVDKKKQREKDVQEVLKQLEQIRSAVESSFLAEAVKNSIGEKCDYIRVSIQYIALDKDAEEREKDGQEPAG